MNEPRRLFVWRVFFRTVRNYVLFGAAVYAIAGPLSAATWIVLVASFVAGVFDGLAEEAK